MSAPEGLTQLEITARSGLARSTVSTLLSGPLAPVLDSEKISGLRPGRRSCRWWINPDAAYCAAIDIGRSHVTVGLGDAQGRIIGEPHTCEVPDTLSSEPEVLSIVGKCLRRLVGTPERCERVAAITIGLPGPVDAEQGMMIDSAVPSWYRVPVRDKLAERWPHRPLPQILVENDAHLGALAEARLAERDAGSLLYLKWSTGLGGGLIIDRELWRGSDGIAGELAHFAATAPRALRHAVQECEQCHSENCLQAIAGGQAIARAVGASNLSEVLEWAWDRDASRHEDARRALEAAARLIGETIAPTLSILNVERLVLGGIAGRNAYELALRGLREGIMAAVPERVRWSGKIILGELGPEAYVRGAALLGRERYVVPFLLGGERVVAEKTEDDALDRDLIAH